MPWRLLPAKELDCGSGATCWRRLRDWQAAGVWEALHHRLLDWLGDDGQLEWSRTAIDSVSRLGRHRRKVERSLAWLLANRRLRVRYQRRADILLAFLQLGSEVLEANQAPEV